MTVEKQKKN